MTPPVLFGVYGPDTVNAALAFVCGVGDEIRPEKLTLIQPVTLHSISGVTMPFQGPQGGGLAMGFAIFVVVEPAFKELFEAKTVKWVESTKSSIIKPPNGFRG